MHGYLSTWSDCSEIAHLDPIVSHQKSGMYGFAFGGHDFSYCFFFFFFRRVLEESASFSSFLCFFLCFLVIISLFSCVFYV